MQYKTFRETLQDITESTNRRGAPPKSDLQEANELNEEIMEFIEALCEHFDLDTQMVLENFVMEKRESPEEREERRERDDIKYHDVRTAAAKRHFAKIEAEYAADAAKKAAIQKKIDRQHKQGEKAGTTNPHRDQQPELGGIRGVGHGDEGMRRVGVQSLKGKDEYFAKIFDTSVKRLNQGVAARNQKRRDALGEDKVNKDTRSRGEIEAHIEGSKSMMEMLKAHRIHASYPGLKAELTSQIEFWKNQIADAKKALKALTEALSEAKGMSYNNRKHIYGSTDPALRDSEEWQFFNPGAKGEAAMDVTVGSAAGKKYLKSLSAKQQAQWAKEKKGNTPNRWGVLPGERDMDEIY